MTPEKETVITKAYDLLKLLIPVLKKLPRDQRFLLGDRIQNYASEILELLIEAYYSSKDQKKPVLLKVNILLEKFRLFVRLGYELGYYPLSKYQRLAEKANEIGRMVGGWLKSL